jgi:hypothetical protein
MVIRIRFAEPADQPALVDFIRDHWSSTHVFAERPEVFDWQYGTGERVNMIFAEDVRDESTSILGILGFIPTGRFDAALGDRDVLLAIWKVRDGAPPGLGLRLLKQIERDLSARLIGAIGISDIVKPIYRLLKYEAGSMVQSAVIRPDVTEFRIADGIPADVRQAGAAEPDPDLSLELLDELPDTLAAIDALASSQIPAKSHRYLVERYVDHPWYRYQLRLVRVSGRPVAVVVWRAVEAEGSRVLRIVDIIGSVDWLARAHGHLQGLTVEHDAEYIDLVQTGIDDALLDAGGFLTLGRVPDLVLPNYFSPFERRNVEIDFAYKVTDADTPVRLFRADSDQDRPNRVTDLAQTGNTGCGPSRK